MSCISPFEMWRVISNKAFNAVFCRLNTISVKPQAAQASRWNHRRPVKVFTKSDLQNDQQSEIIDLTNEFNHTESSKIDGDIEEYISDEEDRFRDKIAKKQFKSGENVVKKVRDDKKKFQKQLLRPDLDPDINFADKKKQTDVFDDNGDLIFTKIGTNNTEICSLMTQLKMKNCRDKKGVMLLEGKRLIREALVAGCELQYLIFSRLDDANYFKDVLPKKNCTLLKMFYRDIQVWSDLVTSPGIIGVFKTPNLEENQVPESASPISIICDSLREPGNLGSVLRISASAGCQSIYLTKGCTDLWNIKVSRGAAGAHFKMNIAKDLEWMSLRKKMPDNAVVIIADNYASETGNDSVRNQFRDKLRLVDYDKIQINRNDHVILIVGGETEGVSENAMQLACELNGYRVHIPLQNNVNSLNSAIALGIIVFEIRKKFTDLLFDNVDKNVNANILNK